MRGIRSWELWELPRALVAAILVQVLLGMAMIAVAVHWSAPARGADWVLLGALTVAGIVSEALTAQKGFVLAARHESDAVDISITTSCVWIFTAVVTSPLYHVAILACTLAVCGDIRIRKSRREGLPTHRIVFNGSLFITAGVCAALAFGLAFRPGQDTGIAGAVLLAGLLAHAVHHLVQYLSLGSVFMLLAGRPYRFSWTLFKDLTSGQLALVSLGLLLAVAWRTDPLLLLAGLPTVSLLQQALLHNQLREAAGRDSKTGLASVTGWREIASRALTRARSSESGTGVLLVDLDHFKRVNDTYGHLVGDDVLRAVANAMTEAVRDSDCVGRFGGEEFVVLLPDSDLSHVAEVAERLRRAIAASEIELPGGQGPLQVTASVGAALYPMHGYRLEELLERADRALYAAKHAGRNRVAFPEDAAAPYTVPLSLQHDSLQRHSPQQDDLPNAGVHPGMGAELGQGVIPGALPAQETRDMPKISPVER